MKFAKMDKIYSTKQITGHNFYGSLRIEGPTLFIQLTQFSKGAVYTMDITNLHLEKEFKRFLIFQKIDELFEELSLNQKIQISDENTLIIPIDVIYKNKTFELKVEVPLLQRKFSNQEQKVQLLLKQMEKMGKSLQQLKKNEQKLQKIQQEFQLRPEYINFKGDETNQRYKTFQVSADKKTIKMLGKNIWTCFNHNSPLKSKGIFCFKTKIIKVVTKRIFLGICTKDLQSKLNTDLYNSPCFMGLHLKCGQLFRNGGYAIVAPQGFTIQEKSILRVDIDMNKKIISWFHNDTHLYSTQLSKDLLNKEIYPMVALADSGETIELLDQ